MQNSKGRVRVPGSKSINDIMRCGDPDFVDFVQKCLIWNPEKRIMPDEARAHKWINKGNNDVAHFNPIIKKERPTLIIDDISSESKPKLAKKEEPSKNISYRLKQFESKDSMHKQLATLDMTGSHRLNESLSGAKMNLNSSFATSTTKALGNTPRGPLEQQVHNANVRNKLKVLKEKLERAGENNAAGFTKYSSGGQQSSKGALKKKANLFLHVMNRNMLPPLLHDSFASVKSSKHNDTLKQLFGQS